MSLDRTLEFSKITAMYNPSDLQNITKEKTSLIVKTPFKKKLKLVYYKEV